MARPEPSEYASQYGEYVALVPEDDIVSAMRAELGRTLAFLSGIADRDATICHPPYTWTIKQVVGHLTDCERIFGYRALCFARGDTMPLPGFDENNYAQSAGSDQRPLADLAAEFEAVRKSHICLFQNIPCRRVGPPRDRQVAATSASAPSRTPSSAMSDTTRRSCTNVSRATRHDRRLPLDPGS